MRIAVVSTPFVSVPPQGYGGTELFCGTLADALVGHGHSVTLFATGDSDCLGEVRAVYPRATWPPTVAAELSHVRWALHEIERSTPPFDVVQTNSALAIRLGVELGLPIVHTLHHKRDDSLSRVYAAHPQVRYVAISRRQRDLEVFLPRISVIHHGLDPNRYPLRRTRAIHEKGHVVHIGRFAPEKGTHLAVLAAIHANTQILVAGRCHEKQDDQRYYDRKVAPLFDHPLVRYVGEADHSRKLELLQGAKALLCPILWEEPFGLIAIEAMMVGTPVIGFRRGSFPEIVDEGVTGFIVDDIRRMTELIPDVDHFDREACAARARERFSADRLAFDYAALFEAETRENANLEAVQEPVVAKPDLGGLGPEIAARA